MSLVNFKKITSQDILRIFLGIVFLSAGIFRIFNPLIAQIELENLKVPGFLTYFLIIFEILTALLLFSKKYLKVVYFSLIFFLAFALINALVVNGKNIVNSAYELFVFNANPTDFLLHFIFLLILIVLIKEFKSK